MSTTHNDFLAPPSGPPPPEVPSGWVARWDARYQTYFYVNLATKQSQWEKPPGTIDRPSSSSSNGDYYDTRPPPYSTSSTPNLRSTEQGANKPQAQYSSLIPHDTHLPAHQPAPRVSTPDQTSSSKSHGITAKIGKFLESRAAAAAARPRYPVYAQSHYGYPQRPMYGGYGGGMYGPPMMMGGHGPRRGLGAGGGAALGLGGGLLGGMMLADAMDNDYQDGFQDGAGFGDDYGGGDFGGGDFGGGDFGGGDF